MDVSGKLLAAVEAGFVEINAPPSLHLGVVGTETETEAVQRDDVCSGRGQRQHHQRRGLGRVSDVRKARRDAEAVHRLARGSGGEGGEKL